MKKTVTGDQMKFILEREVEKGNKIFIPTLTDDSLFKNLATWASQNEIYEDDMETLIHMYIEIAPAAFRLENMADKLPDLNFRMSREKESVRKFLETMRKTKERAEKEGW